MISYYWITNNYKISATQIVNIYLSHVSVSYLSVWRSRLGPMGAKPLGLALLHLPLSSGTSRLDLEFSINENHWHIDSILRHDLDLTLKHCISNQMMVPWKEWTVSLLCFDSPKRTKCQEQCFKWVIDTNFLDFMTLDASRDHFYNYFNCVTHVTNCSVLNSLKLSL